MKPDKRQVANRLQLVKNELNITLSEFGEILGKYSKSTVNSWLRGLALAPDSVIKKASELSLIYSEDWIRWGSIKDIIDTYIAQNKYQEFAKNYPEKVNKIINEVELLTNNVSEIGTKLKIVEDVIEEAYQPIFKEFINTSIKKYSNQIPNYILNRKEPESFYKNNYENYVWNRIKCEPKSKKICYGDIINLDRVAYCEFNRWIDRYVQEDEQYYYNNNLLKYLIETTKDENGVKKLLSNIIFQNRFNINYKTELSKGILDLFLNIHLDLKKLELNSTSDENKETFKKKN